MSRPRYTSAESTLTISVPRRCAQSTASAVLPEAVGPMSAIAGGRRSIGMRAKHSDLRATIDRMPRWKALGFLLVFVVPALMPAAAWLGVASGRPDWAAWFPLLFLFVLLPAADAVLGHDPANVPAESEAAVANTRWFVALTLLAVPVQAVLLAWSAAWFTQAGFGPIGAAGWLLSQGVVGGILAINTAHELIHKDGRIERAAGGWLLAS